MTVTGLGVSKVQNGFSFILKCWHFKKRQPIHVVEKSKQNKKVGSESLSYPNPKLPVLSQDLSLLILPKIVYACVI